jgi:hypothetical protein
MTNVIAKLKQDPDSGALTITEDIKVSASITDGVNRIGVWKGDLFAVWEVEGRLNPAQAETEAHSRQPDAIYVFAEGNVLYELDDEYLATVKS